MASPKLFLLVAAWIALPPVGGAQPSTHDSTSYIYIQGDKELPFYAALDGKMSERYGVNHVTIPGTTPGRHELTISFRRNEMPPETFHIDVPPSYHCGYLLVLKEGHYVLYNIETKTYLAPEP
jgi:hypothetical protein